jgi:hypothetical protein
LVVKNGASAIATAQPMNAARGDVPDDLGLLLPLLASRRRSVRISLDR